MPKKDYTCSDETWASAGGVWCKDCTGMVPPSLFNAEKRCSIHGFTLRMQAGVDMSGCNRGSINKQTKRI